MPGVKRTVLIWVSTWISGSMLLFIRYLVFPDFGNNGLGLDAASLTAIAGIMVFAGSAIFTLPLLILNFLAYLALQKIKSKSETYKTGLILLFSFLSCSLNFALFMPFYGELAFKLIVYYWPYFITGMASSLYFFRDIAFEKYARLENPFNTPIPDDREEEF